MFIQCENIWGWSGWTQANTEVKQKRPKKCNLAAILRATSSQKWSHQNTSGIFFLENHKREFWQSPNDHFKENTYMGHQKAR